MTTLIINADDLGYEPQVTRGILEAMTDGVVSSTTMIVNGPYSEDAAEKVRGGAFAIGLHLNLARWAPLSNLPPRLLGSNGEFHEAQAEHLPALAVVIETIAQLERLEQLTGRAASHIDVHKHLHRHPEVLEGLIRVAQEHRLPVRSIDPRMRGRLRQAGVTTNDAFLGEAGDIPYWTRERLRSQLDDLPKTGSVELMCHPGYAPLLLKSGYSTQRVAELSTFVSDAAREWLEEKKLTPTSWWALHPPA